MTNGSRVMSIFCAKMGLGVAKNGANSTLTTDSNSATWKIPLIGVSFKKNEFDKMGQKTLLIE